MLRNNATVQGPGKAPDQTEMRARMGVCSHTPRRTVAATMPSSPMGDGYLTLCSSTNEVESGEYSGNSAGAIEPVHFFLFMSIKK